LPEKGEKITYFIHLHNVPPGDQAGVRVNFDPEKQLFT
jgi:hypothetical protein